jgi:hypothetical protein
MNSQEAAARALTERLETMPELERNVATEARSMQVAMENLSAQIASQTAPAIMQLQIAWLAFLQTIEMGPLGSFQMFLDNMERVREIISRPIKIAYDADTGGGIGGPAKKTGGSSARKNPYIEFYDFAGEWMDRHNEVILQWQEDEHNIRQVETALKDLAEVTMDQEEAFENMDESSDGFFRKMAMWQEAVSQVGTALSQAFEAALFSGENFFKVMGQFIENFIKKMIAAALASALLTIIFGGSAAMFGGAFKSIMGFGSLDGIPQLAEGGIVTRPTLALIGEAGPEAVVPLKNGGGMGGFEVTTVRVEGADLLLAIQRTQRNQGRTASIG